MKICFITTGNIRDLATAKRALGMANHLFDLGWEVHLLMEDCIENRNRTKLECNKSINLHFYRKANAFNELRQKNAIVSKIAPDFVYICAYVFRNLIFNKVQILIEHSELQSGMAENRMFKRFKPLIFEFLSVLHADGLLFASRFLEKEFTNRYKLSEAKRIKSLYFPYAFSPEVLGQSLLLQTEKQISPKEHKIFVYLGSLVENYGLFTMIKAFEILQQKELNVILYLLGEGEDELKAKQYILEHNLSETIKMPGYIAEEEIKAYFEQADAFLSPMNDTIQDWARCPSKVYMYLPYQKPIVTCRIGEPYETLGEDGFYYKSSDAYSMAEICEGIIRKDIDKTHVNPELHTWKYRTIEFDTWIKMSFEKD